MGKALIAFIVLIVILGIIVLAFFGQYVSVKNTLVSKNEAVKAAWSQVDIVLQRLVRRCSRQELRKRRSLPTDNSTEPWVACYWLSRTIPN